MELEFNKGKFVSSKDSINYLEVLEDFKNAKQIKIITYNISKDKRMDKLLNELSLLEDVDIEIITNIPNRFEIYYQSKYVDTYRKSARKNIEIYIDKLNPNKFKGKIYPFFNFNNHSKIIGTENIVYIGSANFSNESAYNYETGVIIEDNEFIEKLYESFFQELKESAIPFYDNEFYELRVFIANIFIRVSNLKKQFEKSIFSIKSDNYYFSDYMEFNLESLENLNIVLEELNDIEILIENIDFEKYNCEQEIEDLLEINNKIKKIELESLIYFDSPISNYLNFDYDSIFQSKFENYSEVSFDENLEIYIEKAGYEARDVENELKDESEEDIKSLKIEIENLFNYLKELYEKVEKIENIFVSKEIDNT